MKVACLIARKLGWELLDHHLVDRIARIADLDARTAAQFDSQAAHWWRRLQTAGNNSTACRPYVFPRWLDEVDEDSVHPLATQLIQAAADSGECVVVGHGAQCFLQGRSDIFNVLVYAPLEERVLAMQTRQPECSDVQALLKRMDAQRARYIRHYHGRDWLDPTLYNLCINTSFGPGRAATMINDAVAFPDWSSMPNAEKEVSPCHSLDQL